MNTLTGNEAEVIAVEVERKEGNEESHAVTMIAVALVLVLKKGFCFHLLMKSGLSLRNEDQERN